MSNPKDDYRPNIVWTIRNYPARKKEYEELHRQAMAFQMTGMPSGCEVSRAAENIALREMAPMKQREYEAVTKAIAVTKMLPNGDKRLELIERKYWKYGNIQMKYVIPHVHVAEATGWRWHKEFIDLVGDFLGYKS